MDSQDDRPAQAKPELRDAPISGVVQYDYVNTVVNHAGTPDHIELMVSVPLVDGTAAETRVTLGAPVKRMGSGGKYEYSMNMSSNLSIIQGERSPTGEAVVQRRDGLNWEIPVGYPGAWTCLLDHEPLVKEFLVTRFREGQTFVDVGANVGAYSLRAASVGMNVYCFEPNPENVRLLKRNTEINNLSIDLSECALGASEGTARLLAAGATSKISEAGTIEVPVRTLDSFSIPRVDLLKVDVEGKELEVLQGARNTLERSRPEMMIEMHHWVGAEKEAALFDLLADLGYRFEYIDRYAQGRHLGVTRPGPGREDDSATPGA